MIRFVDFHDSFSNNVLDWLQKCFSSVDRLTWEQYVSCEEDPSTPIVFGPGPHRPSYYPDVQKKLADSWGDTPFLGVCLGMQFMAVHLGAELKEHPAPKHGSSVKLIWDKEAVEQSILQGHSLPESAGVYHSLGVSAGDPNIVDFVLAKDTDQFALAISRSKLHPNRTPTLGLQFHPESFLSADSLSLLKAWKATL